jgi:hypothetical protein
MAASPLSIAPAIVSNLRRHPFALTPRRLEANRRNARRSSGPRTAEGKARVARNAIKHGFFVAQARWTSAQQRDYAETLEGLRDEFKPQGCTEEHCVRTMAGSYVRMATMLRYENLAALKEHRRRERDLEQRIAAAKPSEAARLAAGREELRREGLWQPTIPGPREAMALVRYQGQLDRTIRHAASELQVLKKLRIDGASTSAKAQKQSHCVAASRSGPEGLEKALRAAFALEEIAKTNRRETSSSGVLSRCGEGPRIPPSSTIKIAKTNPLRARAAGASRKTSSPAIRRTESAKTNPLTPMFTGNRHERRRAEALAKRHR